MQTGFTDQRQMKIYSLSDAIAKHWRGAIKKNGLLPTRFLF